MVKNPRKKTGPSRIRPLNQSVPIQTEEDTNSRPTSVVLRRQRSRVASIQDMWEIADEWWRSAPIARRYYSVTLEDGPTITVFRDLISGDWYEQRV